jgi:predicted N-acetyltransferase YhbS
MSAALDGVHVRASRPDDAPEIEALLRDALAKHGDAHYTDYLRWKHEANPFGRSPAWVADHDGKVVAFRTFLRWDLEVDGSVQRAVRAVDTATAASHRGKGLFRRLTLHALDELRAEGVAFVFNTPNDASRPGYLKMGWEEVGRVEVACSLRGPGAAFDMLRSRVPAALWSEPCTVGIVASEVLDDPDLIARLIRPPTPGQLRTHRTSSYLTWRYGFGPLRYRALPLDDDPQRGLAVFRVRRRGAALEAAVCEVLLPEPDPARARRLIRSVRRATGADYAIWLGDGRFHLPGQGPRLVWRGVTAQRAPTLPSWQLTLGDLELF